MMWNLRRAKSAGVLGRGQVGLRAASITKHMDGTQYFNNPYGHANIQYHPETGRKGPYSSTYILEHLQVRKKRKNTFLEEHTGTFIHQCSTLWRARPIPQTPVLRTNTTQTQAGSSDDLLFYSLEQMPESKCHKGLRVVALPTTKTGIQTAGGYVPWVCLG